MAIRKGREDQLSTTNSIVYDALRAFRDAAFAKIRDYAKKSSGSKYTSDLKEVVGKERWDARVRSAKQLRNARVITQPLLDDFDAQDVTDLPRFFEKKYEALAAVPKRKAELMSALEDIAFFRDGIAHPAFSSVSVEDARRLAERIVTASLIIFNEGSEALGQVRKATDKLFDYVPTATDALIKSLPPRQEVVGHFVGRETELATLYEWLASSVSLWVLEGDGGKGKSSIAYIFCESLETAAGLERIIWLSAKSRRFYEGGIVALTPDFTDLESAFKALAAAYGFADASNAKVDELEKLCTELVQTWPALIVVDDIDSLDEEHDNVAFWFTNALARLSPKCRVLLTTRRQLYGLRSFTSRIDGLTYDETKRFLRAASERHYGDPDRLGSGSIPKMLQNATDGSPLYLEDIVRLILVVGKSPQEIVADWKAVRHDVREYALRREFEMLQPLSKEVLLATALAGEPISRAELLATLGGAESDLEAAIAELHKFFLISPPNIAELTPTFEINRNLAILVKFVTRNDPSVKRIANALAQVRDKSGKPHRVAKDAQRAIRDAVALVSRDQHAEAETLLRKFLLKYPDEGSLLSHLGWVLLHWPDGRRQTEAQAILQRAVDVRHRSIATYKNLGSSYLRSAMYENAASVSAIGLEFFPDDLDLMMVQAEAAARNALELSGRIEVVSDSGAAVVREPLQKALRDVMAVDVELRTSGSPGNRSRLAQFRDLDSRLREAIQGIRG